MQKTTAGLMALILIGAGIGTTVAVGQSGGVDADDCLDLRKAKKRNKCLRRAAAADVQMRAQAQVEPDAIPTATATPTVARTAAAQPAVAALSFADGYPFKDADLTVPLEQQIDPWNFYYRECTSYVAWKLNRDAGASRAPYVFHNQLGVKQLGIVAWSNAGLWENVARSLGFEVNNRPVKGAIAHWRAAEIGSVGHVAYVERVNADGSVDISEYNYPNGNRFGQRRLPTGAPRYIHFRAGVVPDVPGVPGNQLPGRTAGPGPELSGTSQRLSWSAVSGATDYDLGLRDVVSGRFVEDRRVSGTSFTANLAPGGRYRWNVAACNRAGCSAYTPALYFSIAQSAAPQPANTPVPVVVATPKPVVTATATPRPVVTATATPKPVVTATATPRPVVTATATPRPVVTATATPKPVVTATATPRPVVTATATPRPVVTATATPKPVVALPAVPGRLSPGGSRSPGTALPLTSVTIQWQAVTGAAEYDFGIRDMTTGRLVVDTQSTRTYYIARLEKGHTYRWNVRACNSAGCSAFTAPLYFTLQ